MADKITTASAAWLTDPTVFAVNRTPAHSNHVTFSHIPAIGEPSDLKQSLDGEWRVEMVQASDIDLEEEPFAAEDFDDSAFGRIDVPSHLQNAGYMNHKYVNIQYPWDGHENPQEPNVPETNHVALYRRTFTVAERLDTARQNGGTVSITFHGMATAIYVWVNGVSVGDGEDGYSPNDFDITEALHDGENVVAVACYEYASASWLEDQDYWRLHGLFRSVELAAQPHVHIEDMKVEADWNPETATGSLDALLAVRNAKNAATVSATLKDLSGNVVWETALAASDETGIVSGSLDVKPWSAESPTLYELQVVVIGHDGAIVETATQRVGFRRFRIEDGIMKL
ncbi:sugar-binding domain-containing protein, partial [Bifidobacterium pseudocatenulatum]|uniref:sugar-binding domain-containing protein n=1 Tax=Bifidobacterium pseudocatenulatum TaxID=28026 RepID=UPI0022DF6B99